MNPPTEFLLRLYGPCLLVIGIAIVLKPKMFLSILKGIKTDTLVWFLMVTITLIVGVVMVQLHNVWNNFNEFLISLFGWAALVKGVIHLLKPEFCMKVIGEFAKQKNIGPAAWVIVILGGYMCYAGFIA